METFSPLEDDVWLKCRLIIRVLGPDQKPRRGQQVQVRGCGFH